MFANPARVLGLSRYYVVFIPARRRVIWGVGLLAGMLFVGVGIVAIGSGSGLIALPYEMHLIDRRLPFVFRMHMVASAVALLLVPAVIALRTRRTLHRMLGRLLGVFVVAGGLASLPVALVSHSSLPARAGFFVQGLVWLGLFAAGVAAIRAGQLARHRSFMLAMVAVTSGAVWFRLLTAAAIVLDLPFEVVYAVAAWAGWLLPLAVVLWLYPLAAARRIG
jgi:uncharacterized membrane protein